MHKSYTSFKEIKADLKVLQLRRHIALEEMKGLKTELKEDLEPVQWVGTVLKYVKRYGILYIIRKIFR